MLQIHRRPTQMRFKFRKPIQLLVLLFFIFFSCKTDLYKGFQKISVEYSTDRKKLIEKIKPDKNFLYWEYVYLRPGRTSGEEQILKQSGDSLMRKKYSLKKPDKGFFIECMPLYCYSYIIYIDQGKIHYVTDQKELKKFIGKIDNLEEALLISKINGLWFDPNEIKAGSYKKTENGFELNLMKSYDCPIKMEAIKVEIDSLGNFKSKNMGSYYKSTDCIVS